MTVLTESGTIHAQRVAGGRYRARLIEGDRWGSSGYYAREVLERDGPSVWPTGTQIYLDHPSASERADRPERSVRDLAGKITSTPVYEADGLYADVEFYPHTAPILEALWDDVGMSIRAAGTAETAERDGRTGPVITSLSEGISVDVVTRAGAGGKLVAMIESARVAEALPGDLTGNDLERRLEAALGGGAFVQDYTDEWVVYAAWNDGEQRVLRQQAYTADGDGRITLAGEPVDVARRVTYDAQNPPSSLAGVAQESHHQKEEPTMAQIQIDEAEHARLTETAHKVETLEAERDTAVTERDTARAELAEAVKGYDDAQAGKIIAAAKSAFSTLEKAGLNASKPTTEAGRLDVDAFQKIVDEADAEKAAASGAGRPSGLGGGSTEYTEAELNRDLGIITTKEA